MNTVRSLTKSQKILRTNSRNNSSEQKNTTTEIKNRVKGTNSRLDDTEEQISELEDRVVEIIQAEQKKGKKLNEDGLRNFLDNIK